MRIGVISDTHGLLRPEALEALRGSDRILHAGDVGKPGIVEALGDLAPVTAIRGNVDRGAWARAYPEFTAATIDAYLAANPKLRPELVRYAEAARSGCIQ